MYCDFFGFKEQPFTITPNPRFIFLSKNHREAFAHLLYGIESHAGFIELTGEVGSGKTTILRSLLGQLDDEKHRSALIFNPRLSADELLRTINREFGILSSGTIDELMYALNQFLLQENAASRTVVLVIDESQNLDPLVLEQIRMISNLETDTDKLIQIVLAGQPELGIMLESENLRQLNQRIKVRFHLPPLDYEDMISYIDHRLEIAGGWKAVTFTPGALKKIFRQSKGLPRLVNVLCDRALLIAFTEESRAITPGMADQAIRELKRENLTTSPTPLLRQLASVVLITTALVATGFIIGQNQNQGDSTHSAVQPSVSTSPTSGTAVTELIRNDLDTINEIECAVQGFNELARLWNLNPVIEFKGTSVKRVLESASATRGLRLLNLAASKPGELVKADTPCMLELRIPGSKGLRYLPLTGIQGEHFLLIAPVSKKIIAVKESELTAIWTGRALIPWRNPHNLPDFMQPDTSSPHILQLQKMLAKTGNYTGTQSGEFTVETRDAVRKFQTAHSIPVDGIPGPRTLVHLYRASGETTAPRLALQGRS